MFKICVQLSVIVIVRATVIVVGNGVIMVVVVVTGKVRRSIGFGVYD